MTKRISLILVGALVSVVAGGALLTQASAVHAAAGVTTQTITAPTAAAADRFGFAAGISGDGKTAVVGAPGTNPPTAGDVGKAFVFTRKDGTWSLPQQLVPTPSLPQDFFGGAVSLSRDGHVALVGAPGNLFGSGQFNQQASPGAAFIFTEHDGQWTQQAMLTASPAGLPGDSFGYSVALSSDGHEALVGAVGESGIEGAAYLFV